MLTEITDCNGLQGMQNNILGQYYLSNDIDCSGLPNFTPIGIPGSDFRGTLNGGFFRIRNLTISTPSDYAGIFGSITNSEIRNLVLEDITIDLQSSSTYFGVVAGSSANSQIYNIRITTSGQSKINRVTGNAVQNCGGYFFFLIIKISYFSNIFIIFCFKGLQDTQYLQISPTLQLIIL